MRKAWTTTELAALRRLYPELLAQDVADQLGRSIRSVYQKAKEVGVAKSTEFNASDLSRRIQRGKQSQAMAANQFKKGLTPWNKGLKGVTYEACKATQFKKGEMHGAAQHNYAPIGSLRISKDGYLERKVTDDHPVPTRRWVAEHRLVWEKSNGPIPAGHIVVFRPGQKTKVETEITADRLECISRGENARRNHPRTKSPELARLVQLKGAITRQVNRIAREAQEQHP